MTDFVVHELVFCFSNSNYRHETLSITLNEAMEIKGRLFSFNLDIDSKYKYIEKLFNSLKTNIVTGTVQFILAITIDFIKFFAELLQYRNVLDIDLNYFFSALKTV